MSKQYLRSGLSFALAATAVTVLGGETAWADEVVGEQAPGSVGAADATAADATAADATADNDDELRRWAEEAERASEATGEDSGEVSGELIELSGRAPDQGASARHQLERDQLRALPGTGNDALRAVQSLPGVARMPYGLGGLVLRGTSPRDSKVYLDGIEVPTAFHFAAVSAVIPSSMLERVTLVPGGGEAAYGRSVGGRIDIASRTPRGDRWRGGAEVGLLDAQGSAEGPTPGGGAFVVSLRRSYLDAMLGTVMSGDGQRLLPRYWDGQLRWDQPLAGGTLTAMGFFAADRAVMPDTGIASRFARTALRYRRHQGRTTTTALAWLGRDKLAVDGRFKDGSSTDLARTTWPGGVRADALRDTDWGHVAAGLDAIGGRVGTERWVTTPNGWMDHVVADASYLDVAAWAEARWRIADGKLTVTPGGRLEHYGLTDEWVANPRLVVSHELGAVTLREMLGVHHQPPSASDSELASGMDRRATRGVHASVGAEIALPHGFRATVTGFRVALDRVAVTDVEAGPRLRLDMTSGSGLGALARELVDDQLSTYVYQRSVGRGRTWGSEVSLERRSGRWTGWLAYTLSRAERTGDPSRRPGWELYDFDQTHNLSAVGSVELGAWRLGTRVRYTSGNPRLATPALALAATAPGSPSASSSAGTDPQPTGERLPAFFSVDARVDRSWRRGWGVVSVFVDVQNLTNEENPEDVIDDDSGEHRVRGLPLFPSFGLSYQPPP